MLANLVSGALERIGPTVVRAGGGGKVQEVTVLALWEVSWRDAPSEIDSVRCAR